MYNNEIITIDASDVIRYLSTCSSKPAVMDIVGNASGLFQDAKFETLPKINLIDCEDASHMFYGCRRLKNISIDLGNANVADGMFMDCVKMTSAIVESDGLVQCQYMFKNCRKLMEIGFKGAETVENAYEMFSNCESLVDAGMISFDNLNYCGRMFEHCKNMRTFPNIVDKPNRLDLLMYLDTVRA